MNVNNVTAAVLNEKKKKKKKKKHFKQHRVEIKSENDENSNVLIQYVSANDLDETDPLYNDFAQVFSRFAKPEELCKIPGDKDENDKEKSEGNKSGIKLMDDQMNVDNINGEKPISKKRKN